MTDVEVYQPQAPAALAPVSGSELDVMVRQSEMLAESSIIPKEYRRQPANIFVAAMTGRTFGWDVMTAMRNGHVIEGTWSIKPEAMVALVRRAGHSLTGETNERGAVARGKRGDTGDEMTVEFTMADAQRAGLAGKQNWKHYPQSMCWARAVSQLCRMLFADVTLGLSYTPEELGAEVDPDGAVIDAPSHPAIAPVEESPYVSAANVERLREQCDELGIDIAEVVRRATDGRTDDPAQILKTEVVRVRDAKVAVTEEADDRDAEAADEAEAARHEGTEPVEYEPGTEPF